MSLPSGPRIREKDTASTLWDFGPGFRVEGLPKSRMLPNVVIDGLPGAVLQPSLIREEPRQISVSGLLYSDSASQSAQQAAIESDLDNILTHIGVSDPVWISRDDSDTRYIEAVYQATTHQYMERSGRTIASCRFRFLALDPHWYTLTAGTYSDTFGTESENITITLNGNAYYEPLVSAAITGTTNQLWIRNYGSGAHGGTALYEIHHSGNLSSGGTLEYDCPKVKAETIYGVTRTSVIGLAGESYMIDGFRLLPGTNNIRITVTGSLTLTISYKHAYF